MKTLFIKTFPTDLHRAVKARAAEQGRTLTEVVIEALTKWLKDTK